MNQSTDTSPEVLLTTDMVDGLRTRGAFTTATVVALGLNPRKLESGWAKKLAGRKIPTAMYEAARAGVGKYSKQTFKLYRKRHNGQEHPAFVPKPSDRSDLF